MITLDDHALCEQHPVASAALPDLACSGYMPAGSRVIRCTAPAEWTVQFSRDSPRSDFCTAHAATWLRYLDELAARQAGRAS